MGEVFLHPKRLITFEAGAYTHVSRGWPGEGGQGGEGTDIWALGLGLLCYLGWVCCVAPCLWGEGGLLNVYGFVSVCVFLSSTYAVAGCLFILPVMPFAAKLCALGSVIVNINIIYTVSGTVEAPACCVYAGQMHGP